MAKLQVALDLVDFENFFEIAQAAYSGGADILEIGTPTIKKFGIDNLLPPLKKRFPESEILADMKTLDTGALEVEVACDADIVVVEGNASFETIREFIRVADGYAIDSMVATTGREIDRERLQRLVLLKPDYILRHVGINDQVAGKTLMGSFYQDEFGLYAEKGVKLALAGGITLDNIHQYKNFPVDVFVVGGGITKSKNPYEITKKLKHIIANF